LTVAAVFEGTMSDEQAERLAELMAEARPTRPEGVLTAALHREGDAVQLVAYWRDREALDAYLATTDVPRGVELMRKVGVEPEWRVVEVLELG
jgi:quinol monooxygenase YgiN